MSIPVDLLTRSREHSGDEKRRETISGIRQLFEDGTDGGDRPLGLAGEEDTRETDDRNLARAGDPSSSCIVHEEKSGARLPRERERLRLSGTQKLRKVPDQGRVRDGFDGDPPRTERTGKNRCTGPAGIERELCVHGRRDDDLFVQPSEQPQVLDPCQPDEGPGVRNHRMGS